MGTSRFNRLGFCLATFLVAAICACSNNGGDSPQPAMTSLDAGVQLPEQVRGMLDVLFMIDNSGSMREPQARLRRAFPAFEAAIRNPKGVLPSLHIGVVSSDLGAGDDFGGSTACGRLLVKSAKRAWLSNITWMFPEKAIINVDSLQNLASRCAPRAS